MTDQTPDPWALMVQKWRGDAGVLRAAANPLSASDMEAAKMEEGAATLLYCAEQVDSALAAERAQHQQEMSQTVPCPACGWPMPPAFYEFNMICPCCAFEPECDDVGDGSVERFAEKWNGQWWSSRVKPPKIVAQRDETIRQLQDALARCQEVQQATAETWRIEHDQMAEQIRLLRGAMAADDERLRRAAEQAGILYVSCDTAEALAEQIARLSAQVRKLEAELALARSAGSRDLNLRMNEANKALRAERDAAQQQIATLTQERDDLRAALDAKDRDVSTRDLLNSAGRRQFDRAEAAEARCATLTAALEQAKKDFGMVACDGSTAGFAARRVDAALQSTRPQEQP